MSPDIDAVTRLLQEERVSMNFHALPKVMLELRTSSRMQMQSRLYYALNTSEVSNSRS